MKESRKEVIGTLLYLLGFIPAICAIPAFFAAFFVAAGRNLAVAFGASENYSDTPYVILVFIPIIVFIISMILMNYGCKLADFDGKRTGLGKRQIDIRILKNIFK